MKKVLFSIFFLLLILPTVWQNFLPGYYSMHDDLQVMRIFQMEKCFQDGQIPCRWSPDMAYGFGQPMFNFYSAFPYYLGYLLKFTTPLSIIGSVKALFFIAIFASGIGMFMLSRKFFGFWGGLVSAVFYVYAPYHAVDIYVRGALSESFALAIIPFVWLFIHNLLEKPKVQSMLLFAGSLAALLTTHNLSTMIWAPFTLIWTIFWLVQYRDDLLKKIISLGLAGFLGVGIASFFLLPVFFEKSLIQSEFLTVNYLDYENHFVSLKQLFFDRSWAYEGSIFGPDDKMSFQIGVLHWAVAIFVGLYLLRAFQKKNFSKNILLTSMILSFAGFSTYLTHSKSLFIWKSLEDTMAFIQFPWRFLGLVIFFLSFVSAAFLPKSRLTKPWVASILITLAVLLNFNYFKPLYYFPDETDQTKLSGELFEIQSKSAILDYLPQTAEMAPKAPAGEPSLNSDGFIDNFTYRSNFFFFDVEAYEDGTVDIPVTYFPGWVVFDGDTQIYSRPDGLYGTIHVDVVEGKHMIKGRFLNTPIRKYSNLISLVSFGLFTLLYIFRKEIDKKWLQ